MKDLIFLCFLSVAAAGDAREHRISNRLLKAMILVGVLWNAYCCNPILKIFCVCLLSFGLGAVLYSMRVLGAGDVKLMTVCGMFVSWDRLLWIWYISLLITGVVGLFAYTSKEQLRQHFLAAGSYLITLVEGKKVRPYSMGIGTNNAVTQPFGVHVLLAVLWLLIVKGDI